MLRALERHPNPKGRLRDTEEAQAARSSIVNTSAFENR